MIFIDYFSLHFQTLPVDTGLSYVAVGARLFARHSEREDLVL
jgi:hypothetical protein